MADDLQQWLKNLPATISRGVGEDFLAAVQKHAGHIREAAPQGKSGKLKQSVAVEPAGSALQLAIVAGGPLTTKDLKRSGGYRREITIGQGDNANVPRGNAGVSYDYALGVEFGNSHMSAKPFFYSTHRAHRAELIDDIHNAVGKVLSKA